MANSKISALTAATTPLAGTEVLPVVQSSTTKQVSVANLTAGRSVSAASLSLTTTPLGVGSGGTGLSAVTANQVLFGYTSGALSASSNFVYDYTNIRLGIGTSTPWSQASILTPSGGTLGYYGVKDSVYGGDVRFGKASGADNNGIVGTWSNNDFLLYANSAEVARATAAGDFKLIAGNLIINTAAKGITGSSAFSVTIANGASGTLVNLATALPAGGSGLVIVAGASAGKATILVQRDQGGYYSASELGTQPRGTYITSITISGTNLQITNSTGGSETFSGKVVVLTA